jgi:hypothetical protein
MQKKKSIQSRRRVVACLEDFEQFKGNEIRHQAMFTVNLAVRPRILEVIKAVANETNWDLSMVVRFAIEHGGLADCVEIWFSKQPELQEKYLTMLGKKPKELKA